MSGSSTLHKPRAAGAALDSLQIRAQGTDAQGAASLGQSLATGFAEDMAQLLPRLHESLNITELKLRVHAGMASDLADLEQLIRAQFVTQLESAAGLHHSEEGQGHA